MNPTIGSKWTNVAHKKAVWVVKELNPNGTVTVVSEDAPWIQSLTTTRPLSLSPRQKSR